MQNRSEGKISRTETQSKENFKLDVGQGKVKMKIKTVKCDAICLQIEKKSREWDEPICPLQRPNLNDKSSQEDKQGQMSTVNVTRLDPPVGVSLNPDGNKT